MRSDWGIIIGSVFGGLVITFLTVIIGLMSVEDSVTSWIIVLIAAFLISTIYFFQAILSEEFNKLCNNYPCGVVEWGKGKGYKMEINPSRSKLSWSQKLKAIKSEKEIKLIESEIHSEYNRIAFLYRKGLDAFIANSSKHEMIDVVRHKDEIARLDKKEETRIRHERLKNEFEAMRLQYPLGVAQWMKNNLINSAISYRQIEKAKQEESLIAEIERQERRKIELKEKKQKALEAWKKEQSLFKDHCRKLARDLLKTFGFYHYCINISISDIHSDTEYKVWQFFPYAYCNESDLDYSYFHSVRDNTIKVNQHNYSVKSNKVEKIVNYINTLNKEEKVSVYFCPPEDNSLISVYNEIYTLITESLDETIDEAQTFAPFMDNYQAVFNKWIKKINRRLIIVDVCTDNDRLKKICQTTAKKAVNKRPFINFISLYKQFDRGEMEKLIDDKRKEEEKKQLDQARRRKIEDAQRRMLGAVSSWDSLTNGLKYTYLFYYYPTTCDFEATEEEWENRRTVWNFKNDPAKGVSELEHEEALDEVIPSLKKRLIDTFEEENLHFLTLVCLPASTKTKNEARYKEFSERLCQETGMENGYEHIHFLRDGLSKNDPNNESGRSIQPKISFDDWFENKYVILFDDVVTKGNTMLRYKRKLEEVGAVVVGGMCLGKTKHTRVEE